MSQVWSEKEPREEKEAYRQSVAPARQGESGSFALARDAGERCQVEVNVGENRLRCALSRVSAWCAQTVGAV